MCPAPHAPGIADPRDFAAPGSAEPRDDLRRLRRTEGAGARDEGVSMDSLDVGEIYVNGIFMEISCDVTVVFCGFMWCFLSFKDSTLSRGLGS